MKTHLLIIVLSLVVFNFSLAKKHAHRHHEAHVHGAATLAIAFDQQQGKSEGKVEFKAASHGILGFEHEAKSKKDQETLKKAISQFEKNISQMIQFEPGAACVFTQEKIEMQNDKSKHSNFVANFNVSCQKDISQTKVILDFTFFKDLNDIETTFLIKDLQKSVEVKTKPMTVELK
jgi:Protein of unknown function (DUF2796)